MPHRTKLVGLPSLAALEWRVPAEAARGVRVRGCALHAGRLVYRADGNVRVPGIHEDGETPRVLAADEAGARWMEPVSQGGWLVLRRMVPGTVPSRARGFVLLGPAGQRVDVEGDSCAINARGTHAAVAVLSARRLELVELASGTHRELATLDAGMDPLLPPVLDVDDAAERVLFTDAREERVDASLDVITVSTGERVRLRGPLRAPAHVTARFIPGGARVLATEMLPGDAPVFRIVELAPGREPRVLVEMGHAQPFSQPVFVSERAAVMLLAPVKDEVASNPGAELVVVGMDSGGAVPVTRGARLRGTVRVHGELVTVEGGEQLGTARVLRG